MLNGFKSWQQKRDDQVLDVKALEAVFPSQAELEDDPDFNRHFAVGQAADVLGGLESSRQAATDLSKWLLTSLAALNSGGAISVTQIKVGGSLGVAAGGVFLSGIVASLLAGQMGVRSWMKLTFPMGKQLGYWRAVQHNGYRDRATEMELLTLGSAALQEMRWPIRLGYLALASFLLGAGIVGVGHFGF